MSLRNSSLLDANSTGHPEFLWIDEPVGGKLKRFFDLLASCLIALLLFPLLSFLYLLVWGQTGSNPIYKHKRVGFGGVLFDCYKFKSMIDNGSEVLEQHLKENPDAAEEWSIYRKLKNDPRVTPVGSFLRKSSLDELPQIFNVIRGEMSLVGPRPIVQEELNDRGLDGVQYLRVRPGITGLWQVSGRSNLTVDDRVSLDKKYSMEMSFAKDIFILLKTIPCLLKREGAV